MTGDFVAMSDNLRRRASVGIRASAILLVGLAHARFVCVAHAADDKPAAPAAKEKLIDREPFDKIILNRASGGAAVEVVPLDLPQRPLTVVPKSGAIKVRVLDHPAEGFTVAWRDVAEVRVYEQLLLDEAQRLSAAGNFDEAYDYFARLKSAYPKFPGLKEAIAAYLEQNALALYQSKQHDRALALLITLSQHNPAYPTLPDDVNKVASDVIQRYLREGNYAAARRVLDVWKSQFAAAAAKGATEWQQRFEQAAERQIAEANRLVEQKQYIPARKSVSRALAIWPTLESAKPVLDRIAREFPFVTVGVLETSPRQAPRRIDDWATLRASRLTQHLLAEEIDFGSDAGVYQSPFGQWNLDDTGRELTLKLNAKTPTPTVDELSRFLLTIATPGNPLYRADYASLLGSVSIAGGDAVTLHLRRVHVRPEALLQVPPPGSTYQIGDYGVVAHSPEQVMFAVRNGAARTGGPQAIVEQTITSDESAITAMQTGELDLLERVPPWQIDRLREVPDVHIGTYKLPTVHVLIPNLARPLLASREFRRALCFGIDRKWIVDKVLLGGTPRAGFQAVSGPFPAGTSLSDPIRYGYNNQAAARPFEPRLAAILATVAWANVQKAAAKDAAQNPAGKNGAAKDAAKKPPEELPELTLAYPADPIARVACQSIQAQLAREGIPIRLQEFSADDLAAGKVDCDLRYAELTVGEPLVDARTILGPRGIAGDIHSAFLDTALRSLDAASSWKDVRLRLADLHDIANHELPIIPLWQTINNFAYRGTVRGINDSPIALYQNIHDWTMTLNSNVARADTPQP